MCVIARRQTAGRGRLGRSWSSPAGAGLYFSIVLRPRIEPGQRPLLTLLSAVAVFETLRGKYRLRPDIKWANDVLVGGKKISGILAETTETARGPVVVVGIGINLSSAGLPPELRDTATSIEDETGIAPAPEDVLGELIGQLKKFYRQFTDDGEDGAGEIRAAWTCRSSYASGMEVRVALPDRVLTGTTRGITEEGALRLETAGGEIILIHAGEVQKLRKKS